ncbi:hypothetical protein D6783_02555 [Candidatus Woesearchaeota archaeon]|nr:MAG: hypothetical protein D6783_02555 [Candidatus Woesearchaeota archaeon]
MIHDGTKEESPLPSGYVIVTNFHPFSEVLEESLKRAIRESVLEKDAYIDELRRKAENVRFFPVDTCGAGADDLCHIIERSKEMRGLDSLIISVDIAEWLAIPSGPGMFRHAVVFGRHPDFKNYERFVARNAKNRANVPERSQQPSPYGAWYQLEKEGSLDIVQGSVKEVVACVVDYIKRRLEEYHSR